MAKIKVTVERIDGHCNLPMLVGDTFHLDGSKLKIPDGKQMCIWALNSMMPVFPVMDNKKHLPDNHWIKTVKHFTCPDPKGKVLFRLEMEEHD